MYGQSWFGAHHAGRYQLGYFGKYAGCDGGVARLGGLAVCKKKIARREAQAEACNLEASYFRRALALVFLFELPLFIFDEH